MSTLHGRGAVRSGLLPTALRTGLVAFLLALSSACSAANTRSDYDPWEKMNRGTFWFNEKVDTYALEPIAKGWEWIMPDPLERAIERFFDNLRFPINLLNNLLQGKLAAAGEETGRFLVNSTVGLAGFMDPASSWGLEAHEEDFGQTLGVWGVQPGPYLVIPLLGPSNVRDGVGRVADGFTTVYPYFLSFYVTLAVSGVQVVNWRALNLEEIETAKEASLDYYVFVRNAYFQRRMEQVHDGKPPRAEEDPYDESLYDEPYDDEQYDDESGNQGP